MLKSLRGLGNRHLEWIRNFAASVQFTGDEDAFIEYIIGFVLTAGVSLNVETGLFTPNVPVAIGGINDPAIKALLEGQQKLISDLTAQVTAITSAPEKSVMTIPTLSLKALSDLNVAYDHPQWVVRMLWMMKALILRLPLPVAKMHMTEKWGDDQLRPLLLNLSDAQKSDETRWTELKLDNGDVEMSERTSEVVSTTEALWALLYTAVHKYKEKYESDSSQSKQAAQNSEFTQGLSPAGCRLKRVISKRFRVQDGVEYFEVHKGEWAPIRSQWAPVKPAGVKVPSIGTGSGSAPTWSEETPPPPVELWHKLVGALRSSTSPASAAQQTQVASEVWVHWPSILEAWKALGTATPMTAYQRRSSPRGGTRNTYASHLR